MRRKGDQPKANEMPEDDDVVEVDMSAPETGTMEVTAEFDDVVVWGHEAVVDAAADPYVRGMEEWFSIADKVSSPHSSRRRQSKAEWYRFIRIPSQVPAQRGKRGNAI